MQSVRRRLMSIHWLALKESVREFSAQTERPPGLSCNALTGFPGLKIIPA